MIPESADGPSESKDTEDIVEWVEWYRHMCMHRRQVLAGRQDKDVYPNAQSLLPI